MKNSSFYNAHEFFFTEYSDIHYLENECNKGIAFSLNRGVKLAFDLKADFIVTFDDDTHFCNDYVYRCLSFFSNNRSEPVGGICLSRGEEFCFLDSGFRVKRTLITSGFFCRALVYERLSLFPDEYFIDLVDFYLSLEIRSNGYKLVELSDVGMIHMVGNMKILHLPFTVNVFNHSPFRLYYQVRNSIPFFIRFWRIDFVLCAYILLDILRIPLKAILFEDRKISRIKYCFKGLWHGIKGRMGRLND
ncbi:hypothetical protein VT06_14725 [Arsukibacterium sp. MJ3]|nr:hypothetical protein VT06_14725 [Arsukibacterium sp. MJ3]